MDLNMVRQLAALIQQTGLSVLEVQEGEFRIRLEQTSRLTNEGNQPVRAIASISPVEDAPDTTDEAMKDIPPVEEERFEVCSPIVGIFFATTKLGREADIKAGDVVEAGQLLCAIEAMKLMNEITAEVSGQIHEVMVQTGDMVEYGQVLFTISRRIQTIDGM